MATIRDIAKRAKVSVSTASLALRSDRRVRPETRQRVLDVVSELDYRPSRSARSLSSGLTYTIHLVNPLGTELTSGFFTHFLRGLHDAASEHSYTVAFSVISGDAEAVEHIETLMRERWTDGIVLLNPSENSALLDLMAARAFPYVVLGRDPNGPALSVDNDNCRVGGDAARYLIRGGRRKLGFVNGTAQQTFAQDRATGFLAAVQAEEVEGEVLYTDGSADVAAQRALEAAHSGCDGLILASDTQAVAALRALLNEGVRVPDEVALMGMNNDAIGEYVVPTLTTVDLSAFELGAQAAALLLERVARPGIDLERRLVPHSLVERSST